MKVWEDFEIDCTNFLNEQYGEYAKFIHLGQSDSTVPDIKVVTNNNKQFYIEAKLSPAQCGQFVLFPNIATKKFEYSRLNTVEINEFSQIIINHMNNNYEEFKQAGTAGKSIEFEDCENVFAQWILKTYKEKGVKFFITTNNILVPIEQFLEYFKVSAKYRIKRSGSSPVCKKDFLAVKNHLNSAFSNIELITTDKNVFVNSNDNLHNQRFMLGEKEFMISQRKGCFEVRQLSNTFNANVIFSIELKSNKEGMSKISFIFVLRN